MNRRLLFAIVIVLLFAVGVVVWFFFFTKPNPATSLGTTNNPLSLKSFPKQFQFILGGAPTPDSVSTTEVTFPTPQALTQIWKRPATGQTFVDQDVVREIIATSTVGTTTISIKKLVHATSTVLMFVDRTTGYIYTYNRDLNKIYQVSNTTLPGIYDAYIFNNGKQIVLRYVDNEKQNIVGMLAGIPLVGDKEQAKPLENVTFLPEQVTSVAVNAKRNLLSYLVTGDKGGSIYTVVQKGATFVANTPFKEWSLSYGGDTLYATSKPSAYVEGQTVRLPSFESQIGAMTGLESNPSEKGLLLNSMWSSNGLKTFLSSGANQVVLTSTTLASKCAWGQKDFLICAVPKTLPKSVEGLPDDWFQGRVSFDDTLVTVDARTSLVSSLYSFDTEKDPLFDITNLSLSNNNIYISFTRKQDSSLWLLDTSLLSSGE